MGDDIECPSCRKVATIPAAGVAALQTNFYAKYIQNLVYGSGKINIIFFIKEVFVFLDTIYFVFICTFTSRSNSPAANGLKWSRTSS